MTVLVTGAAGFIGFSIANTLLRDNNYEIIGIDNFDDYYDPNLKHDRVSILRKFKNYQ